jgi:hypothetical protein
VIGLSNRQTVSQSASERFHTLSVPQSANVASLCRNFGPVGYNFGYKSGGKLAERRVGSGLL